MERVEQLQHAISDKNRPERLSPVRKRQRHDGQTQEDAAATDHQGQRPFGFSGVCASHLVEEPRHCQRSQLNPSKNGKAQRNTGSDGHVGSQRLTILPFTSGRERERSDRPARPTLSTSRYLHVWPAGARGAPCSHHLRLSRRFGARRPWKHATTTTTSATTR